MGPLLQPAECSLMLVDPRIQHASRAGRRAQHLLWGFHEVQVAARAAAVPVHLILASKAPDPPEEPTAPDRHVAGVHITSSGDPPWSRSSLAEALAAQGRTSLILCGFWLETTVTFLGLPALASSFDVFVLMDVSLVRADEAPRSAGDRLLQAGAVPVTTHQLIVEWAEQPPDPHVRSSPTSLIATPQGSTFPRCRPRRSAHVPHGSPRPSRQTTLARRVRISMWGNEGRLGL
jgi:hypothetical protein